MEKLFYVVNKNGSEAGEAMQIRACELGFKYNHNEAGQTIYENVEVIYMEQTSKKLMFSEDTRNIEANKKFDEERFEYVEISYEAFMNESLETLRKVLV